MPPSALGHLRVEMIDGVATIDLSVLGCVTPALMVGVAALAHRAVDADTPFRLIGPADANVRSYLARMGLGRELSSLGATHDIPVLVHARDRSNDLLKVRPIQTEAQANSLATLVHTNVRSYDSRLANALFKSLAEVGDNVADHSRATGYMAAQKIPARNELHLAVADGGVGLLHWLGPTLGAQNDADALGLALAGRSRYTNESDRGGGMLEAIELVALMSGTATVASGTAWSRDQGESRRRGTRQQAYTGTLFEARIPLASGLRSR